MLYVAVVLDLYSRRIVGWSMKSEMTAQLVVDALVMAVWRRGKPKELLHHSDQGSQGEFNPSSQHLLKGGDDGRTKEEVEQGPAREAAVARTAAGLAPSGPVAVLESDRSGAQQRGCGRRRGRVRGCRHSMVPTMWRYATLASRTIGAAGHGPLPVVRRA
jgi:hypothetical protein